MVRNIEIKVSDFYDKNIVYDIFSVNDCRVISVDYDETKFIDEDFYSFEGKRCTIRSLFIQSLSDLFSVQSFTYDESSKLLLKNFYQYDDNLEVIPTEISDYLKYYFEIIINGKIVFGGVPEYSSYSYSEEDNTVSFDLVDISYILFQNIDDNTALGIYHSWFKKNKSQLYISQNPNTKKICLSEMPTSNIVDIFTISSIYPIDISYRLHIDLPSAVTNTLSIPSSTKATIVYNESKTLEYLRQYSKEGEFTDTMYKYGYYWYFNAKRSTTIPKTMLFRDIENNSVLYLHYYAQVELYYNSGEVGSFNRVHVLAIRGCYNEYDDFNINGIYSKLKHKDVPFTIMIEVDYDFILNEDTPLMHIMTENGFDRTKLFYYNTHARDVLQNYKLPYIVSPTDFINVITSPKTTLNGIDYNLESYYEFNIFKEVINTFGEYPIRLTRFISNTGDFLSGDGKNKSSSGLYNPDKFDQSQFLKNCCMSIGGYLMFNYINDKNNVSLMKLTNGEATSIVIDKRLIITQKTESGIFDINKATKELDFAETDLNSILTASKIYFMKTFGISGKKKTFDIIDTELTSSIKTGDTIYVDNQLLFVNSVRNNHQENTISFETIFVGKQNI